MKVALIQFGADEQKAANLHKTLGLVEEALRSGAQFVLLPEVFNFRGDIRNREVFQAAAEKIPGPSSKPFMALAQKHKAFILLGSIIEKATKTLAFNTSIFIDPHGNIAAKYRKIHLFDARIGDKIIKETDYFKAGRQPVVVRLGEFRAGLSICYDLRFPALYQGYSQKGVEILTVPSCFTRKTGQAHWESLLRARAIENLCYVLAPGQVGTDSRGIEAHGHSMIISPWGEILAQGSPSAQQIVLADINIEEVRRARAVLPGIIKQL